MTGTMNGDASVATAAASDRLAQPQTALRRRSSVVATVVVPAKLSVSVPSTSPNGSTASRYPKHEHVLPKGSPPSHLDYTSLKDLLPQFSAGAINSPTAASPASGRSGYEISIRNRLVKQAAWAYLQPMSASPGSSAPCFLRRLWHRLCSPVHTCLNSILQALYGILLSLLRCCSAR